MPMRAIPRIKTRDGNSYIPAEAQAAQVKSQSGQQTPQSFRHDPYGPQARVYVGSNPASNAETPRAATPEPREALPQGTLHQELEGLVSFLPYPTTSFVLPPDTIYPEQTGSEVKRMFLGQLPYFITEMQLSWILYTFGNRHAVTSPERIIKRNPRTGARQVTGCIHAFASAEGLATMSRLCHKKLLIDDTGVWYCRNEEEKAVLADYCLAMKKDIKLRPWERPYDSVVMQEATSGAQSQKPSYLNAEQQRRVTASNFNEQQQRHFDQAAFAEFQHRGAPRQQQQQQHYSPQYAAGYDDQYNNNGYYHQQQQQYSNNRPRKYSMENSSDNEEYVAHQ